MADKKKNHIKTRIFITEILFFMIILFLGAKSIDIQVFKAKELDGKARQEYSTQLVVKGKRGSILDRNMKNLGTSVDTLSVAACPSTIKNPSAVARKLSAILDISASELTEKLKSKKLFTWVKRRITPDQVAKIKQLDIDGIFFRNDSQRFYPNRTLAAQVIGFTGSEENGLEGIEFEYDTILEGKTQELRVKKDGTGKLLDAEKKIFAQLTGDSIVLTIDQSIQYFSEKALKEAVIAHGAETGTAVVMDPSSGELLAMAHYPEFNPNTFSSYTEKIWRNRAIADAFEPGSIMKIFTAAAALEKDFFSPKSIFFCENGTYRIGRFTVHDTHPYGWLTLKQVIQYSSNIGAAKISETLGSKTLHDSLYDFGFGRKTDIRYPYETRGNLIPHYRWSKIDAGAIAFGQGISASAVQLIAAVSAIANDGVLMQPILVKKIISNTGETIRVFNPTPVKQVISKETALKVQEMMHSVTQEDGTGTNAAIEGYTVCGKTGTAQKAGKEGSGYMENKYTAVFTGFTPRTDPKLAILVVIDEPKKNHYGGVVAAPAFKSIMTESFNYLKIPPEVDSPRLLATLPQEGVE